MYLVEKHTLIMRLMQLFLISFTLLLLNSCSNSGNGQDQFTKEAVPTDERFLRFEVVRDSAATIIRQTIDDATPEERIRINGISLYSSVKIPNFYTTHEFKPMWIKHPDSLKRIHELINYIQAIEFHGLIPAHYHLDTIQYLVSQLEFNELSPMNPHLIASLDLLMSDAFFMMSSHLYNGKVNPEHLKAEWGIQRNKPQLMLDEKLTMWLKDDSMPLANFMERFYPPNPGYVKMVEYAEQLKKKLPFDSIQVNVPKEKLTLHILEDTVYNEALLKRLKFLGYTSADSLNYTDSLQELFSAIKNLQKQHGLNQDGAIGRNTFNALVRKTDEKLKKLYVNMERLRWMPDSLAPKYILVNIADFTLDYMSGNDTLLHMKTVVGKEFRQTPVFHATMTYLVFSPTWTVPPGILRADVLPAVAKNINYLAQKNMIVLDNSGKQIDPTTIDWQKARKGSFPYRIRQQPGAQNALGRVKFMFPNKYSVYLHDTPSKELFSRDGRTFSSGCIRIEKPRELAELLLENDSKWNPDKIEEAMFSEQEQSVVLKNKVGIYIYYLTAWGLINGEIHFREDIYSRDEELCKELQKAKY